MKKPLVKIMAAVAAATVFAFLFMRSLQDTRSEPYTIPAQQLRAWTLALEPASNPNDPLLVLRPVPELASGVFKQIFSRSMESLTSPAVASVPLVLRSEFDRTVGDRMTQDSMVAAARAARVESTPPTPRCLVHRHVSEPGGVRQIYFIHLDAPAIAQFRRQVGLDPEALPPILSVAGAGADFNTWLPQRVGLDDCLALIEVVD